jgi:hypothetical protein
VIAVIADGALAQAVPERSQAARLASGFRRWPVAGVDPFRHVFWPAFGLVISGGGAGWNNSVNAEDLGALIFLSDETDNPSGLLPSDYLNLIGLVPSGQGLSGSAQAEGGVSLGGALGRRLSIAVSAQGRGYGSATIDESVVRFFQEGNAADSVFEVGETSGTALATAEGGVHALIHLGPVSSVDGPIVTVGFGGRYVRPLAYGRGFLDTDSRIFVTGDSIAANVAAEAQYAAEVDGADTSFKFLPTGSGFAADFLVRLTWPTAGLAVEAMVANLGSVTVEGVRRETVEFAVATRSITEVADSLDVLESETQGLDNTVDLTLPRIVRFGASAWANRILQLDGVATLPVGGDFASPLVVELGSTWRFVNALPLRVGLLLDGRQGIGYTGGVGVETSNFLFRVSGGSLGGFLRNATGAVGRVELGFLF